MALAKQLHAQDLAAGLGEVYLPYALARKYPNAARQSGWQYLFPAGATTVDPRFGTTRRQHLTDKYGERLVSARYKYDAAAGERFTTVDLIQEESASSNGPPVLTEMEQAARSQRFAVRVDYCESELREEIKSAGAIWRSRHKLWEMRYDDIVALGLESGVVADDAPPSEV
jgi:hypothetical protein